MAIVAKHLLTSGSDTASTSFTTDSVNLSANKLVLVSVANAFSPSGVVEPTISGASRTWEKVITKVDTATVRRVTVFRSLSGSANSGALTIDFGSQSQLACVWSISEFENVDTTGTNGSGAIVQTASNQGTGAVTVTLGAFSDAANATYGAMRGGSETIVAGTGFTELGKYRPGTTGSYSQTQWKNSNDTTVDWSSSPNGSGSYIGVAIELNATASSESPSISPSISPSESASPSPSSSISNSPSSSESPSESPSPSSSESPSPSPSSEGSSESHSISPSPSSSQSPSSSISPSISPSLSSSVSASISSSQSSSPSASQSPSSSPSSSPSASTPPTGTYKRNEIPFGIKNGFPIQVTGTKIATWDFAGRPSNPATGEIGVNTEENKIEIYDGTNWVAIDNNAFLAGETALTAAITSSAIDSTGKIYAGYNNGLYGFREGDLYWTLLQTFPSTDYFRAVFVASNDYVYASAKTSDSNYSGLWRSKDGITFTRVLTLAAGEHIWGIDEDANGNIYAGVYTLEATANSKLYKSTDFGATFSMVKNFTPFRHIHALTVNKSNGDVYVALGDTYASPQIYKSTDGGTNWSSISGILQTTAIIAQSGFRLFGSDQSPYGRIQRTTDDSTITTVLDTHYQNVFFLRRNPVTGNIYAGFKTDPSATTNLFATLHKSTDDGVTWTEIARLSSLTAGEGYWFASEFHKNKLLICYKVSNAFQNGLVLTDE